MTLSSTIRKGTFLGVVAAFGLLITSIMGLAWVDSRRVAHYNDEISDLRRNMASRDGQIQTLHRKLADCITIISSPDSSRSVPAADLNGWDKP